MAKSRMNIYEISEKISYMDSNIFVSQIMGHGVDAHELWEATGEEIDSFLVSFNSRPQIIEVENSTSSHVVSKITNLIKKTVYVCGFNLDNQLILMKKK